MSKPTRLYCITARSTDRFYVGITKKTVAQRWSGHVSDARAGKAHHLSKAIRKYGSDDFDVEELFLYGSLSEALAAEVALIHQLNLTAEGYNSSPGGEYAALFTGRRHTPEIRARMSVVHRGKSKTISPKQRAQISAFRTGRKHSPETRATISVSNKKYWEIRR